MEDTDNEDDSEVSAEEFFDVVKKFKSKKSVTYNFLVNAGLKFKMAVFKLYKRFLYSKKFPESFCCVIIVLSFMEIVMILFSVPSYETVFLRLLFFLFPD